MALVYIDKPKTTLLTQPAAANDKKSAPRR